MQSPYVLFVLIAAPRARGNERIERGLVQCPANSDRLAFVHRDRIQHERCGDRLVRAIARQIIAQRISRSPVIVSDVGVVEYLHPQGEPTLRIWCARNCSSRG
jgi:hypothetical protein